MRIGAILAKVTLLLLGEVLADLGLVVVVGDVEHLVLYLDRQLLQKEHFSLTFCFQVWVTSTCRNA